MNNVLQRTAPVRREVFDPKKRAHLDSLKSYLNTGNWGAVQFYPEAPYLDVPSTVLARYARHALKLPQGSIQTRSLQAA